MDLAPMNAVHKASELDRLARTMQPITGAGVVEVYIHDGVVSVTVDGYNLIRVSGDVLRVSATSEKR